MLPRLRTILAQRRNLARHAFTAPTRAYTAPATPSPSSHVITEVEKILLGTVKATGPVSFSTYMQLCLSHPTHGYYTNPAHSVFGASGDFVTSPEISQVFAELIGVWLLEHWSTNAPQKKFRIVELGPGRGTMLEDICLHVSPVLPRFASILPQFTGIHLVDSSLHMQKLQEERLGDAARSRGWDLKWYDWLADVPSDPEQYTLFIAHEFFDALPVQVIERTEQGWHEIMIAPSDDPSIKYARPSVDSTAADGSTAESSPVSSSTEPSTSPLPPPATSARWTRVLSPQPTASSQLLAAFSPRFAELPVGTRIEVSAASAKAAHTIGELLTPGGGAGLVVDYGKEHVLGDSLRAFKEHRQVDIFTSPGECDITADVDFALLKESFKDSATTHGTLSQGNYLRRMGIDLRTRVLMQSAKSDDRRRAIETASKRLIDPLGMGEQYRIMGVSVPQKGEEVYPFLKEMDGK
ncbi:DUF185-domain-containing protein [Coniophora puteana RWD-64-598 SS2]|uniref:Protein arginine methyltransferase NDUFAF7 n=1 Tax=Coniophora puteana (strain RWD-64-598) TaxID=741705 RepID=A0A5M3MYW6_CONPW|nr:DUF185-domain-containing protein [Coniophora puteana RWD-64-598 SS2]EIW84246.1 DUF185-domain-containing protein [Coniophora puteana RWD-64-598 SS2]